MITAARLCRDAGTGFGPGVDELRQQTVRKRQREGIAKANAAGKYKGRPVSIDAARVKRLSAEMGPAAIAKRLGIARSSVYRLLA